MDNTCLVCQKFEIDDLETLRGDDDTGNPDASPFVCHARNDFLFFAIVTNRENFSELVVLDLRKF